MVVLECSVLRSAVEFYCWADAAPRRYGRLVIHSENFNETAEAGLDSLSPLAKKHWANYPLGVAWALHPAGKPLTCANFFYAGEIPLGAGLSLAAAVVVVFSFCLFGGGKRRPDPTALDQLIQ